MSAALIVTWLRANAPGAELTSDSRRVGAGDVFLAYAPEPENGVEQDGRTYIQNALERGARAVVYDDHGFVWETSWSVPHYGCSNLRRAAGELSSTYYDHPDSAMFTVAVTGTNGKTSCTQWMGAALSRIGVPTTVIGTFGIKTFDAKKSGVTSPTDVTGYTTPDAVQLQRALAKARSQKVAAVAIEASSIGLQQQRLKGMHIDVALFTNLSRDHLDYHDGMQSYEDAKTMLFDWPGLKHAVINLDDAMGLRLIERLRVRSPDVKLTGYTLHPENFEGRQSIDLGKDGTLLGASELRDIRDARSAHAGMQFQLQDLFGKSLVKTRLVGDFNIANVLGVLAVLLAYGCKKDDAIAAIESLDPVEGRMQQIGGTEQPLVVIDYAHTPDALKQALTSLRRLSYGRNGALWCVFGCGGGRDAGKRPQMGRVAQLADHVVVTSDNPRGEIPAKIIGDIVAGFDHTHGGELAPQIIEDRATAILWALRHAGKNDVVLLAGKGHENYQEVKGRKLPFLDADHAALALAARLTMKGPV
jgi:UDP-N-acetylmuramoyl-L-alanyl-D-glutamate--2,6-diaminopimelate ligase